MNKRIEAILREQEKLNKDNLFATVNRETGKLLHLFIKAKNPKTVLEVGTSIGYSTIWIASALSKDARLITLEKWPERSDLAEKFFKKAKLPIELVEGDALETIPKLKRKFDIVFIDATKSQYLQYLKKVKLKKHALIIADNAISHASKMQDFLEYVKKQGGVILDVGSGIALLSKN
jgi:predicted O-methyltransferase YrrM